MVSVLSIALVIEVCYTQDKWAPGLQDRENFSTIACCLRTLASGGPEPMV